MALERSLLLALRGAGERRRCGLGARGGGRVRAGKTRREGLACWRGVLAFLPAC